MATNKEHSFSKNEQKAIAAIVGQIIPASALFDQPGADDPEIIRDILETGSHLKDRLALAVAAFMDGNVVDATKVANFRHGFPTEAKLLQTLTIQCYYRDPRVMRALQIEIRPPFPGGYVQEPNDLSLLEPVRQRGDIYRKVR